MYKIVDIQPDNENYSLFIKFEDGVSGTIYLQDKLKGPILGALMDPHLFKRVSLDGYGVPVWPNGADLAPDAMYKQLKNEAKVL